MRIVAPFVPRSCSLARTAARRAARRPGRARRRTCSSSSPTASTSTSRRPARTARSSKPAEIWFLWHDGAVYVGTRPTSWRVKRIKAGRPEAKIAVGKVDGPSFMATGSLVNDPKIEALMLEDLRQEVSRRLGDARGQLPRRVQGRQPGGGEVRAEELIRAIRAMSSDRRSRECHRPSQPRSAAAPPRCAGTSSRSPPRSTATSAARCRAPT